MTGKGPGCVKTPRGRCAPGFLRRVGDEWFTPAYIFEALGCRFDMDVASPGSGHTPWIPADAFLTHDSLTRRWRGFVWMNAPFGGRNGSVPWLEKFFEHGNGIALVPDRTSAPWWQDFVPRSDVVLFVSPKIKFVDERGREPFACRLLEPPT